MRIWKGSNEFSMIFWPWGDEAERGKPTPPSFHLKLEFSDGKCIRSEMKGGISNMHSVVYPAGHNLDAYRTRVWGGAWRLH